MAMALALIASAACAVQNASLAADAGDGVAAGDPAHVQPFDAIPTAAPELLASLRGGLRAGGLDLEFTANVRTLVNGALVLESTTSLTPGSLTPGSLTPGGTTVSQSSMPGTGIDPTTLSFVNGAGNAQSNVLPATLAGLAGKTGVVVDDPTGITTALHSVTREQILGVVLTTASNQQIRQEINVEVTVANFGRFQEAARSALFGGRLLGSLNFAQ